MEAVGLETSGLHVRRDMATSVNVVLVKKNGERCFLTNPHGSQRQLRLEDIAPALNTWIICFPTTRRPCW